MYIVMYYIPKFDGNPDFKIKMFEDLPSAKQFVTHLEKDTCFDVHGLYQATKLLSPYTDNINLGEEMNKMSISELLVYNYIHGFGIIQRCQLDDALFNEWIRITTALFKCGRKIRHNEEWSSPSDIRMLPEHDEIYELVKRAFDMIGDVNGYSLHRDHSLGMQIVAYASKRSDKDDQKSGYNKSRAVFRLRLENLLARKIIEQQSKTPDMLADDIEDIKLVRRLIRNRHKLLEQKCPNGKFEATPPNVLPSVNIEFTTFVVRCYSFKCNKNHNVEQIRAIIEVMVPDGTIIREEVAAGYCKDCNLYFVFDADYLRLRERGILLCQLVSQKTYEQEEYEIFNGKVLKPESVLHQSGYNVSSSDDITDVQRQEILRRVIDNGLYSKTALLGFLDWLISRNEKVSKKDMSCALHKWRTDRDYVANYNLKAHRGVQVKKLSK